MFGSLLNTLFNRPLTEDALAHKSDVLKGYVSTLLGYKKQAPQSFKGVKPLLRPVPS